MKKSLLALTVFGAFAGAASAQTNTTVYGIFEDGMAGAASGFFGGNIFTAIDIRMQNAVFYSNTFGGLKADLAYSVGEVAGNTSASSQVSTAFTYTAGPAKAVFGYHNAKDAAGERGIINTI